MFQTEKRTRLIIFLAGLVLFLYVVVRAIVLSITYDEAYSYLEFARKDFWIAKEFNYMAANNHLLNTWLIKISIWLFGISEFSVRLPNVLFHLGYLFFSYKIVQGFRSPLIIISAFLLLNTNPYLLDFFSAARGYGISMALLMASLYYLHLYCKKETGLGYAVVSLITAEISALANISMLNYLIVLVFVLCLLSILKSPKEKFGIHLFKSIAVLIVVTGIFCYLYLPYVFKLKEAGAFFYGGDDGFWKDTMNSLADAMMYETFYSTTAKFPLMIFGLVSLAGTFVFLSVKLIRKLFSWEHCFLLSVFLIIVGCIASAKAQHYFLHTKFLWDRTALFFIPLFFLLFSLLFEKLKSFRLAAPVVAGLAFLAVFHCTCNFNLRYLLSWQPDADTKDVIEFLIQNKKTTYSERANLNIGIDFVFETNINFYRVKDKLNWLNFARTEPADSLNDYFLLYKDSKTIPALFKAKQLLKFKETGNVLYENGLDPSAIKITELFDNFEKSEGKNICDESFENGKKSNLTDTLFRYSTGNTFSIPDSLQGKHLIASFTAQVKPLQNNFEGAIVVSFEKPDGAIFSWQSMDIKDFCSKGKEWTKVSLTRIFPTDCKTGDVMKIYLWNTGDLPVLIDNMHTDILLYTF